MRADFYLLPTDSKEASWLFACRIIEKAYNHAQPIYVHTASQAEANYLNELLWTYRDNSFIPHALASANVIPPPPVIIGYETEYHLNNNDTAILLVLTPTLPHFFTQFPRIIEIIPNEELMKANARQHYRLLQQQQAEIHTHKIN